MAYDTVIDKAQLEGAITASANAIREKTGDTALIEWLSDKGFAEAIAAIKAGGGLELITTEMVFAENTRNYEMEIPEGKQAVFAGFVLAPANSTGTFPSGSAPQSSINFLVKESGHLYYSKVRHNGSTSTGRQDARTYYYENRTEMLSYSEASDISSTNVGTSIIKNAVSFWDGGADTYSIPAGKQCLFFVGVK